MTVLLTLLLVGLSAGASVHAGGVEVRGEQLYVDGERFLVKGVGYAPYRPGQTPWNTTVSLETLAGDFARIRQAGFNTIRTWRPLSPEALALAGEHGLKVLQGVWIDPDRDYASDTFRTLLQEVVQQEVERAHTSEHVLAVLVGNELSPARAAQAGVSETEASLRLAYETAKRVDPQRLISHANWPRLSALDGSLWDLVCVNVYPYEPASVSHSFGFRGYLEHLTHTVAKGTPVLITELGVSASPKPGSRPGYGGSTPEAQAEEVLALWDAVFQAGTQGGSVFAWQDEWWKQADELGDAQAHDPDDPEEWFGLNVFRSLDQTDPEPRPVHDALRAYNQAILIEPISEQPYREWLPVSIYATEAVANVRLRLGWGWWHRATQVSPHWWQARLRLWPPWFSKQVRLVMEARDAAGNVLIQQERLVRVGPAEPARTVTLETDRDRYEVTGGPAPLRFTIRVLGPDHQPVAGQRVALSIDEPAIEATLTPTKLTNADGEVTGTYLVQEPGLVTLAAAIVPDRDRPQRRVGAERSVVVEQLPPIIPAETHLPHQPSPWEQRAAPVLGEALHHPAPAFQRAHPGAERLIDYTRYGRFHGIGTPDYHYEIIDREGLAKAVGEGIYPNEEGLRLDPAYRAAVRAGSLEGSPWDFTHHEDVQLSFFKWAGTLEEPGGVKQFYTALALERAGLLQAAVNAYYAVLVHFPDAVGWTQFTTPWYVGPVARDRIEAILRLHPELGLRLEDARVIVRQGFDNTVDNDEVIPYPGQLVDASADEATPPSAPPEGERPMIQELGQGRIRLRQDANRHWRLLVDGRPYVIRGLSYQPSAVGQSPDDGTLTRNDWMTIDRNDNGRPDGPFDTFVDANRNNRQDPDEPTVGDFRLLEELGVNTIRLYHHDALNTALLRQLYEQYGIMVLMGDLVGKYTVGSGARWEDGTDYLDPVQRERMTASVQRMVREFKDEPYVLMWVLGNENNYAGQHGIIGGQGNAAQHPEEFYRFLNGLAEWIHQEDPHHPVAIANGEWLFLDRIAQHAPAIDVFGANVYRGWHGFGRSFFEAVQEHLDKPVFISEFGCPAFQAGEPVAVTERDQAVYHFSNWIDLEAHLAGRGVGNALGGVVFEWVDEWWKAGQPPRFSASVQETTPNWSGPFPGGKNYEEWFGLTGQGDGRLSPFLRQPRLSYRLYQALWKE